MNRERIPWNPQLFLLKSLLYSFKKLKMTLKNKSPLNNVEARHTILATHSIEKASEHCHTHTGPAGACGSYITAPLVCFGVIPTENTLRAEFILHIESLAMFTYSVT